MTDPDLKMQQFARHYPQGTVIFRENEPGTTMYVIQSGLVRVYRSMGETEIILALLGPGDFFGEMAVLESLPRTASAEVVQDAQVIEMDRQTFEEVIKRNSEIALRIMRKLSARVREADQRIHTLMLEGALARVLEVLRALVTKSTARRGDKQLIPPAMVAAIPQHAGLPWPIVENVLLRLQQASIVERLPDGTMLCAPMATIADYSEYLALKNDFDPLSVSELAEISGLAEQEAHDLMQRILKEHIEQEGASDSREAAEYRRYLELKCRFEYVTAASASS